MSRTELPTRKRSVYRVHCYTAQIMREITGAGFVIRCDISKPVSHLPPAALFRARRAFRTPATRELRDQVAAEARRRRAAR